MRTRQNFIASVAGSPASFPPMILCDNKVCKIDLIHYSCANVKKARSKVGLLPSS